MKFQRTRGVLRLMAAVIHSLWEKGDRNPLILPANIPIDDPRVQFELTRYLSDNWVPVIEKDVDGPSSLPLRLDGEVPEPRQVRRLPARGAHHLPRLGAHDDRRQPRPGGPAREARLCDAGRVAGGLRRCAAAAGGRGHLPLPGRPALLVLDATHRHQAGRGPRRATASATRTRWCRNSTSACAPTCARWATSAASIRCRIERRCARRPRRTPGRAGRRPPLQQGARQRAETAAKAILETRGSTPRLYRNTLVFLAADKTRLQDLDEAVRTYLAWESILSEKEPLDLSPHQVKQAETQQGAADSAVTARLPETYQWLLVPMQTSPQAAVTWQAIRLSGQDALAVRASKKLRNDELLVTSFAATRLRMELDRVPLWRGDHVAIKQLVEDFARYLYLPRLKEAAVLLGAIRDGCALLTWEQDAFAYADSYDEAAQRYRGLRGGQHLTVSDGDTGLLVRPEVARRQINAETPPPQPDGGITGDGHTTRTWDRPRRLSRRPVLPRRPDPDAFTAP